MKTRNIIMAFLALIAAGCAKEQPAGENVAPAAGRTIEVNMPEATKVALGEGTETAVSLVWSEGDEIAVIENKDEASQKVYTYRLIGEGGTTSGTFEYVGEDPAPEVITDVVFPAQSATSGIAAHQTQTYVENDIDNNAMIMTWTRTSDDEAIVLSHKASVLMFTLTGEGQEISSVEVTCNDGTFELKCGTPVELSATGKVFYVAVPGREESLDYTVCFNVSDGVPMVKSFTKALGAGKIGRLPELPFTPFHNLKLGDVYGGGLVFDMKGKDVKVISLDEASSLAWATDDAAVVRIDNKDLDSGEEKAELFRALGADLDKYPAAAWCINKGEGWYLPALNEISAIKKNLETSKAENQTTINNTLTEYGGTAISFSGKYYWACDEYTDGNKARCYNLSTGGNKSTKTTTSNRQVRAVKSITLAGGENPEPKPEAPEVPDTPADKPFAEIQIGDVYGGGVVFEKGDNYVKIISLDEGYVKWGKDDSVVETTSGDLSSGEDKLAKFIEKGISNYPAAEWCHKKGDGWYLPSVTELSAMNAAFNLRNGTDGDRAAINAKFTENNGVELKFYDKNSDAFKNAWYWSCDERSDSETKARRYALGPNSAGNTATKSSNTFYVRAVKKITFAN